MNSLQRNIMLFIDDYSHREKTPIPRKQVIKGMEEQGAKSYTVIKSLQVLIKDGYLRRSCISSNTTSYVQIRRV